MMTIEPKIPMSAEELPQQRIHEVVDIDPMPEQFDCTVGYGAVPADAQAGEEPLSPTHLGQVEWAWTPSHNRLDAYYLDKTRSHWVLWTGSWNFDKSEFSWHAIACVRRQGITQRQAAVHLLIAFWRYDALENKLDEYHWINDKGYLSVADLSAVARCVWADDE
jgi:hypothetical protein